MISGDHKRTIYYSIVAMYTYIIMKHMKQYVHSLLMAFVTLLPMCSYGQSTETSIVDTPMVFSILESLPKYPGGEKAMFKKLEDIIVYPKSAIRD